LTQFGTQRELQPNTVESGFSLYLTPKIHQNTVFLQISTSLSNVVDIGVFPPQLIDNNGGDSTNVSDVIQLPETVEKRFTQRSAIPSGSTLILAGFKHRVDNTAKSKLFGMEILGGKGASSNASELVILITPTVLPSHLVDD